MQADIAITRRSQFHIAPEGLFFEVTVSGFDASGPGAGEVYDDRFHGLYYFWDFDDAYTFTAPKNLPTAHKNANIAYGPMASHTYRASGGYVVSVLVVEPSSGKQATATLNIAIGDPAALFGGTRTVFVSPSSDWSDAPAGAALATSFNAAISTVQGDDTLPKRIMLNRGEIYSFSGASLGQNPGREWPLCHIVAGAGAGANPTVACTGTFLWWDTQTTGNGNDKDFVLQNIDFIGPWDSTTETGDNGVNLFSAFDNPPQLLLVDGCFFSGFSNTFFNSRTSANSDKNSKILNDCVITNWRKYAMFESVSRETAVTGCRMQMHVDARSGGPQTGDYNEQGCWRMPAPSKVIIHSSDFFSRAGWFENVSTYRTIQPCVRFNTNTLQGAKMNMQANAFEGGFPVVQLSSKSQDPGFAVNALIEKNYILGSHMSRHCIQNEFGGVTIRNNIIAMVDTPKIGSQFGPTSFIDMNRYGTDATNQGSPISIYNNTFVNLMASANYFSGAGNAIPLVNNGGGFSALTEENNVNHQPNLTSPVITYAPLDSAILWAPRDKGYISELHPILLSQYATPANSVATFAPLTGSAALGAALNEPAAYDDFYGNQRPQYPSPGALEMA